MPRASMLASLKTSLAAFASIVPRPSKSAPSPLARPLSEEETRVLEETLGALEIPREQVPRWIAHNRAFCEGHGGRRVYKELLELMDACDAVHGETRAIAKPAQNKADR